MEHTRVIFLALLRSALWGTAAEVPSDIDWNEVMKLAKQQTVIGLMADAIMRLPEEKRPDSDIMRKLQTYVAMNIQARMLLTSKLSQSLKVLREAGLRPVLFKGHGLAMNYPEPLSRQCGDIDLYIGKRNFDKAIEVCTGYFGAGEHDTKSVKHYHLNTQGASVELHRIAEVMPGLIANRRYQKWTVENLEEGQLRNVEIDGVNVDLPPYDFDPIYVLYHAWHHFMNGGIGLRQVCDWTMYIHKWHDKIDVAKLEANLRSFGLTKVWRLFAGIAVRHLGLPAEECPLYSGKYLSKADKVLDIIMNEGNFGQHSQWKKVPRPKEYTKGKLHAFKMTTGRYMTILSICPFDIMRAWFTYLFVGIYMYFVPRR